MLLVPEERLIYTRVMAETQGLSERVAITSIETYVGQNLDESAEYRAGDFGQRLRRLFEVYNERVAAIESDQSLQIEIPGNL
jgi:hypothetical protein